MSKDTFFVPLMFDGKKHLPALPGRVVDPAFLPVDSRKSNLLEVTGDGLYLETDGLVSNVAPNALEVAADKALRATVALSFDEISNVLTLTGPQGASLSQVKLPAPLGLPITVELLTDFTPPPQDVNGVIVPMPEGTYLHFQIRLANGTVQDLYLNVSDLVDVYEGGFGIAINGNIVSVVPSQLIGAQEKVLTAKYGSLMTELALGFNAQTQQLELKGVGGVTVAAVNIPVSLGTPTDITLVRDLKLEGYPESDYLRFTYEGPDGTEHIEYVAMGQLAEELSAGAGIAIEDNVVKVVVDAGHGLGFSKNNELTIRPSDLVQDNDKVLVSRDGELGSELGLTLNGNALKLTGVAGQTVAEVQLSDHVDVVNSLASSSTTDALAAAAGKTLNDKIAGVETALAGYYPKTGGYLSGPVILTDPANSALWHLFNFSRASIPEGSQYSAGSYAVDTDFKQFGGISTNITPDYIDTTITAFSPQAATSYAGITLVARKDGTNYSVCVPTRPGVYANDIVTAKHAIDTFKQKYGGQNIYVGGANASDTEQLNGGRGLSSGLPFATLNAAMSWATVAYERSALLNFVLQSNQNLNGLPACPNGPLFHVTSAAGSKYTVTLSGNAQVDGVGLWLKDVIFNSNQYHLEASCNIGPSSCIIIDDNVGFTGSSFILSATGSGAFLNLRGTGITFTGGSASACHAIQVINGASLHGWAAASIAFNGSFQRILTMTTLANGILASTLTGSPTGKRYDLLAMARLYTGGKGVNYIPGDAAGTADSTSTYL